MYRASMKLSLLLLLSGVAAAQTVNPNQIRPGAPGQILGTVGTTTEWIPPSGTTSVGGSVAYVELTSAGSYTACPTTVTFTGGGSPSVAAAASVFCSNEGGTPVPTAIILSDSGYGYTGTPTVTISGGTGSGATAVAEMGSFVIALNATPYPGGGIAPSLVGGILTIPYYPTAVFVTGTPTTGHCASWASPTSLQDAGAACGSGGGGSPGGVNGDVQVNDSSAFGNAGTGGFTYNSTTGAITVGAQNTLTSNQYLTSPGYNFGSPGTGTSVGSLVTNMYNMNLEAYGQGNHSILGGTGIYCMGNGDCNPLVFNGSYSAASIDGSAQGYTGYADQMVISPSNVYTANVASTGTPSGFPGVTMTVSSFNSGVYGVGRWLIDKTTGVLTMTATGATQQGSGTNVYAAVTETGQTFTASKQGSLSAAVNGPTLPNNNNTPILATFTVTISSSCSNGDQFTIGGVNTESAKIVNITSYTGGVMTATAYLRSSHENGAFFMCEGPTGRLLEQNADTTTSSGIRHLFTVLGAINSTTLAVAREVPNGMDSGFISGSGTDTIYQGARIVDARDPALSSSCAGQACFDGNVTLAETTATFTASDALEVPNGTTQTVSGRLLMNLQNFNPYSQDTPINWGCGSGSFECGGFLGGFISNFNNANPTSFYTINSGRNILKKVWGWNGPMGSLNYFNSAPVSAMFEFQHTTGMSIPLWVADDLDFYSALANSSGTTSVTTHANNFTFIGTGSVADAFNNTGVLSNTGAVNLAGSASPLEFNGSAGTSGQCPISGGAGVTPSWGSCGSGGGLSGQTTGYLPLATSATASTTSSALQDTGSQLVYHGTGSGHGITFPASSSAITPVSGSAIYTTDSSGNAAISENGAAASRPCTVANALCTGGASITVNGGSALSSPVNLQNSSGAGAVTVTNPSGSNVQFALASTAVTGTTFLDAAQCNGGVAFATGFSVYDNNAPQLGCYNPASSTAAYLAFQAAPSSAQYAEATTVLPAYWTSTDITVLYTAATATSGTFILEAQTACPASSGSTPGSPTFGTATTVTVTVPGTAGVQGTAAITGIATAGVNSCPSASSSPAQMVYRIFRSASDTATGNIEVTGAILATHRSQ
jgi:hypothetical protein